MESLFFEILNIKDLYHNTNNIITLKKDNTNVKNFTFQISVLINNKDYKNKKENNSENREDIVTYELNYRNNNNNKKEENINNNS